MDNYDLLFSDDYAYESYDSLFDDSYSYDYAMEADEENESSSDESASSGSKKKSIIDTIKAILKKFMDGVKTFLLSIKNFFFGAKHTKEVNGTKVTKVILPDLITFIKECAKAAKEQATKEVLKVSSGFVGMTDYYEYPDFSFWLEASRVQQAKRNRAERQAARDKRRADNQTKGDAYNSEHGDELRKVKRELGAERTQATYDRARIRNAEKHGADTSRATVKNEYTHGLRFSDIEEDAIAIMKACKAENSTLKSFNPLDVATKKLNDAVIKVAKDIYKEAEKQKNISSKQEDDARKDIVNKLDDRKYSSSDLMNESPGASTASSRMERYSSSDLMNESPGASTASSRMERYSSSDLMNESPGASTVTPEEKSAHNAIVVSTNFVQKEAEAAGKSAASTATPSALQKFKIFIKSIGYFFKAIGSGIKKVWKVSALMIKCANMYKKAKKSSGKSGFIGRIVEESYNEGFSAALRECGYNNIAEESYDDPFAYNDLFADDYAYESSDEYMRGYYAALADVSC